MIIQNEELRKNMMKGCSGKTTINTNDIITMSDTGDISYVITDTLENNTTPILKEITSNDPDDVVKVVNENEEYIGLLSIADDKNTNDIIAYSNDGSIKTSFNYSDLKVSNAISDIDSDRLNIMSMAFSDADNTMYSITNDNILQYYVPPKEGIEEYWQYMFPADDITKGMGQMKLKYHDGYLYAIGVEQQDSSESSSNSGNSYVIYPIKVADIEKTKKEYTVLTPLKIQIEEKSDTDANIINFKTFVYKNITYALIVFSDIVVVTKYYDGVLMKDGTNDTIFTIKPSLYNADNNIILDSDYSYCGFVDLVKNKLETEYDINNADNILHPFGMLSLNTFGDKFDNNNKLMPFVTANKNDFSENDINIGYSSNRTDVGSLPTMQVDGFIYLRKVSDNNDNNYVLNQYNENVGYVDITNNSIIYVKGLSDRDGITDSNFLPIKLNHEQYYSVGNNDFYQWRMDNVISESDEQNYQQDIDRTINFCNDILHLTEQDDDKKIIVVENPTIINGRYILEKIKITSDTQIPNDSYQVNDDYYYTLAANSQSSHTIDTNLEALIENNKLKLVYNGNIPYYTYKFNTITQNEEKITYSCIFYDNEKIDFDLIYNNNSSDENLATFNIKETDETVYNTFKSYYLNKDNDTNNYRWNYANINLIASYNIKDYYDYGNALNKSINSSYNIGCFDIKCKIKSDIDINYDNIYTIQYNDLTPTFVIDKNNVRYQVHLTDDNKYIFAISGYDTEYTNDAQEIIIGDTTYLIDENNHTINITIGTETHTKTYVNNVEFIDGENIYLVDETNHKFIIRNTFEITIDDNIHSIVKNGDEIYPINDTNNFNIPKELNFDLSVDLSDNTNDTEQHNYNYAIIKNNGSDESVIMTDGTFKYSNFDFKINYKEKNISYGNLIDTIVDDAFKINGNTYFYADKFVYKYKIQQESNRGYYRINNVPYHITNYNNIIDGLYKDYIVNDGLFELEPIVTGETTNKKYCFSKNSSILSSVNDKIYEYCNTITYDNDKNNYIITYNNKQYVIENIENNNSLSNLYQYVTLFTNNIFKIGSIQYIYYGGEYIYQYISAITNNLFELGNTKYLYKNNSNKIYQYVTSIADNLFELNGIQYIYNGLDKIYQYVSELDSDNVFVIKDNNVPVQYIKIGDVYLYKYFGKITSSNEYTFTYNDIQYYREYNTQSSSYDYYHFGSEVSIDGDNQFTVNNYSGNHKFKIIYNTYNTNPDTEVTTTNIKIYDITDVDDGYSPDQIADFYYDSNNILNNKFDIYNKKYVMTKNSSNKFIINELISDNFVSQVITNGDDFVCEYIFLNESISITDNSFTINGINYYIINNIIVTNNVVIPINNNSFEIGDDVYYINIEIDSENINTSIYKGTIDITNNSFEIGGATYYIYNSIYRNFIYRNEPIEVTNNSFKITENETYYIRSNYIGIAPINYNTDNNKIIIKYNTNNSIIYYIVYNSSKINIDIPQNSLFGTFVINNKVCYFYVASINLVSCKLTNIVNNSFSFNNITYYYSPSTYGLYYEQVIMDGNPQPAEKAFTIDNIRYSIYNNSIFTNFNIVDFTPVITKNFIFNNELVYKTNNTSIPVIILYNEYTPNFTLQINSETTNNLLNLIDVNLLYSINNVFYRFYEKMVVQSVRPIDNIIPLGQLQEENIVPYSNDKTHYCFVEFYIDDSGNKNCRTYVMQNNYKWDIRTNSYERIALPNDPPPKSDVNVGDIFYVKDNSNEDSDNYRYGSGFYLCVNNDTDSTIKERYVSLWNINRDNFYSNNPYGFIFVQTQNNIIGYKIVDDTDSISLETNKIIDGTTGNIISENIVEYVLPDLYKKTSTGNNTEIIEKITFTGNKLQAIKFNQELECDVYLYTIFNNRKYYLTVSTNILPLSFISLYNVSNNLSKADMFYSKTIKKINRTNQETKHYVTTFDRIINSDMLKDDYRNTIDYFDFFFDNNKLYLGINGTDVISDNSGEKILNALEFEYSISLFNNDLNLDLSYKDIVLKQYNDADNSKYKYISTYNTKVKADDESLEDKKKIILYDDSGNFLDDYIPRENDSVFPKNSYTDKHHDIYYISDMIAFKAYNKTIIVGMFNTNKISLFYGSNVLDNKTKFYSKLGDSITDFTEIDFIIPDYGYGKKYNSSNYLNNYIYKSYTSNTSQWVNMDVNVKSKEGLDMSSLEFGTFNNIFLHAKHNQLYLYITTSNGYVVFRELNPLYCDDYISMIPEVFSDGIDFKNKKNPNYKFFGGNYNIPSADNLKKQKDYMYELVDNISSKGYCTLSFSENNSITVQPLVSMFYDTFKESENYVLNDNNGNLFDDYETIKFNENAVVVNGISYEIYYEYIAIGENKFYILKDNNNYILKSLNNDTISNIIVTDDSVKIGNILYDIHKDDKFIIMNNNKYFIKINNNEKYEYNSISNIFVKPDDVDNEPIISNNGYWRCINPSELFILYSNKDVVNITAFDTNVWDVYEEHNDATPNVIHRNVIVFGGYSVDENSEKRSRVSIINCDNKVMNDKIIEKRTGSLPYDSIASQNKPIKYAFRNSNGIYASNDIITHLKLVKNDNGIVKKIILLCKSGRIIASRNITYTDDTCEWIHNVTWKEDIENIPVKLLKDDALIRDFEWLSVETTTDGDLLATGKHGVIVYSHDCETFEGSLSEYDITNVRYNPDTDDIDEYTTIYSVPDDSDDNGEYNYSVIPDDEVLADDPEILDVNENPEYDDEYGDATTINPNAIYIDNCSIFPLYPKNVSNKVYNVTNDLLFLPDNEFRPKELISCTHKEEQKAKKFSFLENGTKSDSYDIANYTNALNIVKYWKYNTTINQFMEVNFGDESNINDYPNIAINKDVEYNYKTNYYVGDVKKTKVYKFKYNYENEYFVDEKDNKSNKSIRQRKNEFVDKYKLMNEIRNTLLTGVKETENKTTGNIDTEVLGYGFKQIRNYETSYRILKKNDCIEIIPIYEYVQYDAYVTENNDIGNLYPDELPGSILRTTNSKIEIDDVIYTISKIENEFKLTNVITLPKTIDQCISFGTGTNAVKYKVTGPNNGVYTLSKIVNGIVSSDDVITTNANGKITISNIEYIVSKSGSEYIFKYENSQTTSERRITINNVEYIIYSLNNEFELVVTKQKFTRTVTTNTSTDTILYNSEFNSLTYKLHIDVNEFKLKSSVKTFITKNNMVTFGEGSNAVTYTISYMLKNKGTDNEVIEYKLTPDNGTVLYTKNRVTINNVQYVVNGPVNGIYSLIPEIVLTTNSNGKITLGGIQYTVTGSNNVYTLTSSTGLSISSVNNKVTVDNVQYVILGSNSDGTYMLKPTETETDSNGKIKIGSGINAVTYTVTGPIDRTYIITPETGTPLSTDDRVTIGGINYNISNYIDKINREYTYNISIKETDDNNVITPPNYILKNNNDNDDIIKISINNNINGNSSSIINHIKDYYIRECNSANIDSHISDIDDITNIIKLKSYVFNINPIGTIVNNTIAATSTKSLNVINTVNEGRDENVYSGYELNYDVELNDTIVERVLNIVGNTSIEYENVSDNIERQLGLSPYTSSVKYNNSIVKESYETFRDNRYSYVVSKLINETYLNDRELMDSNLNRLYKVLCNKMYKTNPNITYIDAYISAFEDCYDILMKSIIKERSFDSTTVVKNYGILDTDEANATSSTSNDNEKRLTMVIFSKSKANVAYGYLDLIRFIRTYKKIYMDANEYIGMVQSFITAKKETATSDGKSLGDSYKALGVDGLSLYSKKAALGYKIYQKALKIRDNSKYRGKYDCNDIYLSRIAQSLALQYGNYFNRIRWTLWTIQTFRNHYEKLAKGW